MENGGSRTANTHFFRKVARPDGSLCSLGYGKDSLVDCLERIARVKWLGVTARDVAGTYPDAASQLVPTAIVDAAREVMRRNHALTAAGRAPTVTAAFEEGGYRIVGDS